MERDITQSIRGCVAAKVENTRRDRGDEGGVKTATIHVDSFTPSSAITATARWPGIACCMYKNARFSRRLRSHTAHRARSNSDAEAHADVAKRLAKAVVTELRQRNVRIRQIEARILTPKKRPDEPARDASSRKRQR